MYLLHHFQHFSEDLYQLTTAYQLTPFYGIFYIHFIFLKPQQPIIREPYHLLIISKWQKYRGAYSLSVISLFHDILKLPHLLKLPHPTLVHQLSANHSLA